MNGDLPDGWKRVKLGEVVESNKLTLGKDYPFKEILYLDTGSITEGKIASFQKFKLSEAPSRARRLVRNKNIIYSTVRPIQRHYGFIREPPENLVVSTGFSVIETDIEKAFPKFVYYFLTSDEVVETLDMIAEGSTSAYPSLKPSDIENLEILLPPLPEQKAIASVLSSLDDKIDLLHRQNRTLEGMAEALFREWFIENPEREGWEEVKLGELIELQRGVSYSGKKLGYDGQGIPMHNLNSINVDGSYKYEGIKYYTGEVKEKHILNSGDLLIINTDITQENRIIGWPIFVPEEFDKSICSHHLYSASLISDKVSKLYLYFLLRNPIYRFELANASNGTTVSMLSKKAILNVRLKLPPVERRLRFEKIASDFISKQTKNQQQIRTLEKLRDTLLPKLMSGEVRVKNGPHAGNAEFAGIGGAIP